MSRGVYDEISPIIAMKGREYDKDLAAQAKFQKEIRQFIETQPLYSDFDIELPPLRDHFFVEVAQLECNICKTIQAFRPPEHPKWYSWADKYKRSSTNQMMRVFDGLTNVVFPIELQCQGCKKSDYSFFVFVDTHNNKLTKFGQFPTLMKKIDPIIIKELGKDTILYRKALTLLDDGYGIGACAYFRRLIEKYINPLLKHLYEIKQLEQAPPEELQKIQDAIDSKEFTRKTKFAADFAPAAILTPGINPLKTIHDFLSKALHKLPEEEAVKVAQQLMISLNYVIPRLKKQLKEQKEFVESLKSININDIPDYEDNE